MITTAADAGREAPEERRRQSVPSCTIIVGTMSGWANCRTVVAALARECATVDGELIVADGSGQAPPVGPEAVEHLRWLAVAATGVFELRSEALREARGRVVVVSEDHTMPSPGWGRRIVAAHDEDALADVIVGQVQNGSRSRVIDWAAFIVNQLPFVPPIDRDEVSRQIGIGGVSLKRRAIEVLRSAHGHVAPELIPEPALRALKLNITVDERLSVQHLQSESWGWQAAHNYHNARAIAGLRRSAMRVRDWLRFFGAPALLVYRCLRVLGRAARKQVPRSVLLAAVPAIFFILAAKGIGDCVGYFAGPGDSARKLQ